MKNPLLKLKYATGLGDVIKCILHSGYIGKIVHLITGLDKPCLTCSQRANALNVLFPIPVWRLFFKDVVEKDKHLIKDMQDFGFKFDNQPKKNENCSSCNNKKEEKQTIYIDNSTALNPLKIDYIEYDGFSLIEKLEKNNKDFKTVILKYKKNN